MKVADLLPVGTRVRVVNGGRFADGATGVVIAHNRLGERLEAELGTEVHTLCYSVRFDEPQRGLDDEFGHNYTPPGGFLMGPFRHDAVVPIAPSEEA